MKKIYLDNNATTHLRKEVLDEMLPFLTEHFGNPASAHDFGKAPDKAVEKARADFAKVINCEPSEIIFTGSGTEADNMAILGLAYSKAGEKRKKIIISSIEHPAVKETAKHLVKKGFVVCYLPVQHNGIIDLEQAKKEIDGNTLLVSIMYANNEIGTIQPVKEIAEIAKAEGALFHTDAIQALGKIDVDVKEIGADFASFSAHKIYGPKGVGALFIRKGIKIEPVLFGGHQEKGLRPATINTAGIVGIATAAKLAKNDLSNGTMDKIKSLRDKLEENLTGKIPHSQINGDIEKRVPNTANISFNFVEGEALMLQANAKGIAISTGSACSSGSLEPSHVILGLGIPASIAHGSIRFSLSRDITEEDIDYTVEVFKNSVENLRNLSPLWEDFIKENK